MDPSTRALLAYLDKVEPALSKLTYYELLDVPRDAGADRIQRAYHAVAARMHPDRFRSRITAEQHERLNIVYGRITEAYRVLRDERERTRYATELSRTGRGADASNDDDQALKLMSAKAQQLYRRAMAALRTGDTTSAALNLKMALRGHPDSALLKAALRKVAKQQKK